MKLTATPADTLPEAARVQLEIYRRMAPEKRLQLAMRMSDTLRRVAMDGIRCRHPVYGDEQVRLAFLRLTLGKELFAKVCPGVDIAV
ncbi:MAG TPA: hypothetical protein VGG61_07935 [Gemmataceae bacterium]|jgi:hypothetical protein